MTFSHIGRVHPAPTGFLSACASAYFLISTYFATSAVDACSKSAKTFLGIHGNPNDGR